MRPFPERPGGSTVPGSRTQRVPTQRRWIAQGEWVSPLAERTMLRIAWRVRTRSHQRHRPAKPLPRVLAGVRRPRLRDRSYRPSRTRWERTPCVTMSGRHGRCTATSHGQRPRWLAGYPEGPYKNASGVQRGSIMDLPLHAGDLLTPGRAAVEGARRPARDEAPAMPTIPTLPIGYGDARAFSMPSIARSRRPNDVAHCPSPTASGRDRPPCNSP